MSEEKKIDLYTFIHKAQRARLFALSAQVGRTDFTDAAEVGAVAQELEFLIAHLRAHSRHENTFVHPLYRELDGQAAVLEEEHDELDEELDKLERIVKEKRWAELYVALNRFIAVYLLHQAEEEQLQIDVLWKHFDNRRLAQVMEAFQAQRTQEQMLEDLAFFLPHLNVSEFGPICQKLPEALRERFLSAGQREQLARY